VVNGVRRHAEPLEDNDPPQLSWKFSIRREAVGR